MNYKEVFQLAQDKGYKLYFPPIDLILDGNEREIELTLIQKWLRDEHKIHIDTGLDSAGKWGWFVCAIANNELLRACNSNPETYEQALLEGINEALKLM